MVYIADWDEFFQRSVELFVAQPGRTRYTIKYSHKDGRLVLKVTNDVVCLKYKTDQQSDLRNMEKLNNLFLRLMSSKKVEGAVEEEAKDAESAAAAAAAGAAGQAQGGPQPAASPGGADRKRKKARN